MFNALCANQSDISDGDCDGGSRMVRIGSSHYCSFIKILTQIIIKGCKSGLASPSYTGEMLTPKLPSGTFVRVHVGGWKKTTT